MTSMVFPDGNYKPFSVATTDTSQTTAYTCPSGMACAVIVWVEVADDGGASRTVTLEWTDSSASATRVLEFQRTLDANIGYAAPMFLSLEPGDSFKITSSAAGVHLTGTVMEVAKRS